MKTKIAFIAQVVVALPFGIVFIAAPGELMSVYHNDPLIPQYIYLTRLYGSMSFGIGGKLSFIAWRGMHIVDKVNGGIVTIQIHHENRNRVFSAQKSSLLQASSSRGSRRKGRTSSAAMEKST
jgi:hypothetical protein